jgi:hypothetical protein
MNLKSHAAIVVLGNPRQIVVTRAASVGSVAALSDK